jgi:hypothetical protein
MADTINDGGRFRQCSRGGCVDMASARLGNARYCDRHYRFASMRASAKRDGKSVPSWDELESLTPNGLLCLCGRTMNWRAKDGASTVITLQHDRDGKHRLICLACNTRHAQHPGDSFYQLPAGHKRCQDCSRVLPVEAFSLDRSRPIGRKSYCRECANVRHEKWSNTNREHVNHKQRERRTRLRSEAA